MSKISLKTKIREGRGEGSGKDYKPFIKAREINSKGTCSNAIDWKTGRQMELLSQTELQIFMQLRWDDSIDEIREQIPLDLQILNNIISKTNTELENAGHPKLTLRYDENHMLTSDMVIFRNGEISEAISVKYDKYNLSNKDVETAWIEKKYWAEMGSGFRMLDRSDVNPILVQNLRLVTEYYNLKNVHDAESMLKHKIATKEIYIDLTTELLDFRKYTDLIKEMEYA